MGRDDSARDHPGERTTLNGTDPMSAFLSDLIEMHNPAHPTKRPRTTLFALVEHPGLRVTAPITWAHQDLHYGIWIPVTRVLGRQTRATGETD